ncbi:BQ2448_4164 [Microbotryum intermedium]|uniref:BQ2448_4164 protein n=1 Tax=Microbotryum intermedium TaxID=269621 RepID=A0A238FHB7_9BASI|nr:BQ2448_4164 [Microbotryum intermedium]
MLSSTASMSIQLLSRRTAILASAATSSATTTPAAAGAAYSMTRTGGIASGALSSSFIASSQRHFATRVDGGKAVPAQPQEHITGDATVRAATPTTTPSQPPAGTPASSPASPSAPVHASTTPATQGTTRSASDPTPPTSTPADSATPSPSESAALSRSSSLAESYLDYTQVVANPSKTQGSTFPGDRTKAKAKGARTKSSIEQKRANLTRFVVGAGVVSLAYGAWSLGKPWENDAERLKLCGRSEDKDAVNDAELGGFQGWVARTKLRGFDILDYYNKPAWDPLLPPPLPEPHYRPYTLVIDLDDMLIHPIWDTKHGWRTAKRPGVDYFLAYLSQFYEIVLFTSQPSYTAAPIIEQLDPYGAYIPWKLFKESLRFKNGTYIKVSPLPRFRDPQLFPDPIFFCSLPISQDLSYLDRPLERTIILDTDPSYTQLQPSNAIHLTPWKGTLGDATSKELVALIPFLEALAVRRVQDVRPVIQHYQGKHIPTAYAQVEAKMKKELVEKWEKEKEAMGKGWGKWVREAFAGIAKKPSDQPPELDIEKQRRISQKMYEEEQKYWKDNEALIKKQIEEDKERQLKEMKGSVLTLMGIAPPPSRSEGQEVKK